MRKFPTTFDFSKVSPIEVRVDGSSREDFEMAVRRFKALFQRERIVGQLKEKSFHEKPSEKKRRKQREAKERQLMSAYREKLTQTGEWDRIQKKKIKDNLQKLEKRAQEVLDV